MKKITIKLDYDLFHGSHYLRVDGYKSEAVYSFPDKHPNECFHCVCLIDLDIAPLEEKVSLLLKDKVALLLNRILNVVETSVNSLLNHDKYR